MQQNISTPSSGGRRQQKEFLRELQLTEMNQRCRRRTADGVMTGPMWVSNNKVLTGPKKPHARNPNFDAEETKILISLWGDPKIQKTLITTHKKHPVIAQIAEKMREFGYHRSTEEVNTRIKNLKCFYNRTKKELDSGEINMTLWRHYDSMDEIMTRPIFGNIGTQLEYQNIYDAKQQHKQSKEDQDMADIASPEVIVKEELHSDEEVDNSEVVMQLLLQAKALAKKKKSLEAEAAVEKTVTDDLIVPKTEPGDDGDVTCSEVSSTPSLSITAVVSNAKVGEPKTSEVTSSVPQSKISLVPTNVLMKPPAPQPPQTVTYSQPKFIIQNTNPTTTLASSGGNKTMQLVFLQTPSTVGSNPTSIIGSLANNTSLSTMTTTQSRPQLPVLKPKPVPTNQQNQQVQYNLQKNNNLNSQNGPVRVAPPQTGVRRREAVEKNLLKKLDLDGGSPDKKGQGFRSLLNQLVHLQNTNLVINRQRLAVERQRLSVERTLGEQIVTSLQALTKVFTTPAAPVQPTEKNTNGIVHEPSSKRQKVSLEEEDDTEFIPDEDSMSQCD